MKLSSTTGLLERNGHSEKLKDLKLTVTLLREVGYEEIDLGFCHQEMDDYILRGDDWEKKIDELGETAAKIGVSFYQCHLPFIPGCSPLRCPDFDAEYFDECTRRAYIAAGKLGVKWAVAHPRTYPEFNYETKATLEANHEWQDEYVALGIKYGVGTAVENMLPALNLKRGLRYCQHYEQLIDYVDSFNDSMVGVCWDTGHANQADLEQGRALRAIGGRLKALHINDNHRKNGGDEHLLPYMGDIDWPAVIDALVDIGYEGTLNYEAQKVGTDACGKAQMDLAKMSYENGLYLLSRYEETLAKKNGEG